jgi:hypothetical protein
VNDTKIDDPTVVVSAVWLRRSGDYAIVSVEIDGIWREVVREHIEGPFSHIAEARGADRWKPDPVGAKTLTAP